MNTTQKVAFVVCIVLIGAVAISTARNAGMITGSVAVVFSFIIGGCAGVFVMFDGKDE